MFHSIPRSFGYAWAGVKTAFLKEPNFRVHVIVGLIVIGAGFMVGLTNLEWIILVLTIVIVIVLELLNTAAEAIVNLVSPQMQESARIAKDTSAAAVFLAAIGAVIVGLLLFVPKLIK